MTKKKRESEAIVFYGVTERSVWLKVKTVQGLRKDNVRILFFPGFDSLTRKRVRNQQQSQRFPVELHDISLGYPLPYLTPFSTFHLHTSIYFGL